MFAGMEEEKGKKYKIQTMPLAPVSRTCFDVMGIPALPKSVQGSGHNPFEVAPLSQPRYRSASSRPMVSFQQHGCIANMN